MEDGMLKRIKEQEQEEKKTETINDYTMNQVVQSKKLMRLIIKAEKYPQQLNVQEGRIVLAFIEGTEQQEKEELENKQESK